MSSSLDELLSAQFDDELTVAEREELAQRAAGDESKEMEATRRDFGTLSTLIASSAPTSAPEGLAAGVMAQIRGEQNSDPRNISDSAAPTETRPTVSRRRSIGIAVVGSLATAAVAVLFAVMLPPAAERHESSMMARSEIGPAADSSVSDSVVEYPAKDSFTDERENTERVALLETPARFEDRPAPVPQPPTFTEMAPTAPGSAADPEPMAAPDAKSFQPEMESVPLGPDNLTVKTQTLKSAAIGDEIVAQFQTGERVSVVRLTVVDRQVGLATLQVLLARQEIVPDADVQMDAVADAEGAKDESKPKSANRGERDDLVAVFVRATPDQMLAALNQLQRQNQFPEIELEAPVQLAQLNLQSRPRAASGRYSVPAEKLAERKADSDDFAEAPTDQAAKPATPPAPRSIAQADPSGTPRAMASRAAPDRGDGSARGSRQYAMTVPKTSLARSGRPLAMRRGVGGGAGLGGGADATGTRPKREDATSPVQVLFVLVGPGETGTDEKPAATKSGS